MFDCIAETVPERSRCLDTVWPKRNRQANVKPPPLALMFFVTSPLTLTTVRPHPSAQHVCTISKDRPRVPHILLYTYSDRNL